VETTPVEKNDGGERQRTAVRSVNMEKHYTHKNVSSTRKQRKRESTFFRFRRRQIRPPNPPEKRNGQPKRKKDDRFTQREREREREREATSWRGNENFISPQPVFRSEINDKRKKNN
jgi:hypothetical protein